MNEKRIAKLKERAETALEDYRRWRATLKSKIPGEPMLSVSAQDVLDLILEAEKSHATRPIQRTLFDEGEE